MILSANQTVAQRVRRLRSRLGWSQHQFAGRLGKRMRRSVDSVTISNMERPEASGRRWTVDELAAAAAVLGVSTGYLLGETVAERLRSLAAELEHEQDGVEALARSDGDGAAVAAAERSGHRREQATPPT